MLTPKSLLTWMMASFFMPWSIAYFAAAVPCSASEVMVRKKMPLALPSCAMRVSVGEEEAGEICTTPAGAVTEVSIGSDTDEMMPPMIAGTRFRSTSWRAWSTATEPWLCESRRSMASWQPATPPASFSSLKASSTDFAAAWPKRPAGPVSSTTTPTVWVQDCAAAATGRSPAARAAADRMRRGARDDLPGGRLVRGARGVPRPGRRGRSGRSVPPRRRFGKPRRARGGPPCARNGGGWVGGGMGGLGRRARGIASRRVRRAPGGPASAGAAGQRERGRGKPRTPG